jgi:MFS transporter, FHS family, L-fucose permease
MAITQVDKSALAAVPPSASTRAALVVVTSLFFMWGFVTALNDVLIPHLKSIFDLNYTRASLIQFAFFAAYFIFSIPAARLIDAIGYKRTIVTGVLVMGAGALLFLPAASVPSYPLFLGALIVLACGITILQVAANPYVAVLGPAKTASSRLNLSQAFNSLGTTVAPLLGGYLILNAAAESMAELRQMAPDALQAYRVHEASSVKLPYLVIGLALLVLGFLISTFKLPPLPGAELHKSDPTDSLWKYRHLVLGAIGIFVYVGAEVSIGSFMINYFGQPDIGNISASQASK